MSVYCDQAWELAEMHQRIRLRSLRAEDLCVFHAYRSDAGVARLQGWQPMSEDEARIFLQAHTFAGEFIAGAWTQLAIVDAADDALIGDLGIHVAADCSVAEIGITIAPDAQGKGYAAEAIRAVIRFIFERTPVECIIACADVRNTPCIRALARAGMRERETREAVYKGERCREVVFSVARCVAENRI